MIDLDLNKFWAKVNDYSQLSEKAKNAWGVLLTKKYIKRNEYYIHEGQIPRKVAFVVKGLLYQYFATDEGAIVVKHFFNEGRIAGSLPATLGKVKTDFNIQALEDTSVLEYDFAEFKKLVLLYPDIAEFYISYMERHWIIDKEPVEISLRKDTAAIRYAEFLKQYPNLVKRLKKHHIASYLGITPTQLSRILLINK